MLKILSFGSELVYLKIDQALEKLKKNLQNHRPYLNGMKNSYTIDRDIYLFKKEIEEFEIKTQDFNPNYS